LSDDARPVAAGTRSLRWYALAAVAALVCLVVFYDAMVFRGYEPISGDTAAAAAHREWSDARLAADGRTPLWYPDIFLGMPSYGSFIYTPGSPLSWLHRTFDMNRGVRYVLWFLIGSIGTLAFVRRFGASPVAAFAATFAVIFTPYLVGSLNAGHSSKLMAMAFAPLVFWAVDRLLARGDLLGVGLVAGATALQLWANHPQIVFYTWMIVGPYALVWLWREGAGVRVRRAALLAASLAVAFLMVALPYLPVYDYAMHSTRGEPSVLPGAAAGGTQSWEYATSWSFHPKELVSLVVPGFFGLEGETYWGYMPFTQSTHAIGIVPLLLAIVGFATMRGWRRNVLLVLVAVVLVIGFGKYVPILYRPLYEWVPQFDKFRVPSMIYAMLPLLAAPAIVTGLDRLAAGDARARRLVLPLLVVAGVLLLVGLALQAGAGAAAGDRWLQRPGQGASPGLVAERHAILASDVVRVGLLAGLVMLASLLRVRGRLPRVPFVIAVVLLLVVDLASLDRKFYAPQPPAIAGDLGLDPAVSEHILADGRPVRVLPLDLSVRGGQLAPELQQGNDFAVERIESVSGYHPAGLRRMKDFILANVWANTSIWPMLDVDFVVVHLRARLSDAQRAQLEEAVGALFPDLGVSLARSTERGEVLVLDYPYSLGRAFVVPSARRIDDPLARIDRLGDPTFDPSRVVIVETDVPDAPAPGESWRAEAAVTSYADERIEVRTEGDGGVLVVADAYHRGWTATIDGETTEVFPANHVLRGVALPPGAHTVVFTFADDTFAMARMLSITGKLLCLASIATGLVLLARRRAGETGGA
jgi:hypothetical protein